MMATGWAFGSRRRLGEENTWLFGRMTGRMGCSAPIATRRRSSDRGRVEFGGAESEGPDVWIRGSDARPGGTWRWRPRSGQGSEKERR